MRVNGKMRNVTVLVIVWAFVLGIAVGPRPAESLDLDGALGDLMGLRTRPAPP